jgi:hypothetical protein
VPAPPRSSARAPTRSAPTSSRLYKVTVADGQFGYWARLSSENSSDVIDNDFKSSGTMYLRVQLSDKYINIGGHITFRTAD